MGKEMTLLSAETFLKACQSRKLQKILIIRQEVQICYS